MGLLLMNSSENLAVGLSRYWMGSLGVASRRQGILFSGALSMTPFLVGKLLTVIPVVKLRDWVQSFLYLMLFGGYPDFMSCKAEKDQIRGWT